MTLDRLVALVFLVLSIAYGYAAFTYPLLPFERNMVFLPNTLPMVLSVLGAILSLLIVLAPRRSADETHDGIDSDTARTFEWGAAGGLVVAMVLYAVLLRPVGFLAATALFIVGSAMVLGERKLQVLVPLALVTAVVVWYLVQEVLGIYLSPWPSIFE